MATVTETCGQCRYFDSGDYMWGFCVANPPTVSEYLLKRAEEMDTKKELDAVDISYAASVDPGVMAERRACRFFVKGANDAC